MDDDDENKTPKSSISSEVALEEVNVSVELSAPQKISSGDVNVATESLTQAEIPPEDMKTSSELFEPRKSTSGDVNICPELLRSCERALEGVEVPPEVLAPHESALEGAKVSTESLERRESAPEDVNVTPESPIACGMIPEDGNISSGFLAPCKFVPKKKYPPPDWQVACGIAPCPYDYGEGGLVFRHGSDEISWQHFPRSTSTISSCHLSSEKESVSASKSSSISSKPDKSQKSSHRSSVSSGPVVMSISQRDADHYLRIRYVHEFFSFLIEHLISNEPENPVQFLVNLINLCIAAREGEAEPPLLYSEQHVHSVYRAFDPFARGSISFKQYEEAMRTLGLYNRMTPSDRNPSLDDKDFVKESTFKNEVERLQLENFKKMTRIPQKWEENRLKWLKRQAELSDTIIERSIETSEEEVCDDECICEDCPHIKKEVGKKICPYPVPHALRHEIALKHEPEQLYL